MKTYQTLIVQGAGPVATLTLNRPQARNAVDMVMRHELMEVLDELEADNAARVVILTGAGGHFCAGGDMKSLRDRVPTATAHRERVRVLNRLVRRLVDFPRPTIAMVDGFALGSGFNLALCCDLIVASEGARFGQVFGKVGLVPDGGGSWLLPRMIGMGRAKELIFTGRIVHAAEAAAIGLVNRVVPADQLETVTRALAEEIAHGPPAAQALSKELLNRATGLDLGAALESEACAQGIAVTGPEHQEGLAALFEKRKPRF
jgi:2-(1,2-epoxy-1,2-dihydrophenyl)acetyl-CoA isomerase